MIIILNKTYISRLIVIIVIKRFLFIIILSLFLKILFTNDFFLFYIFLRKILYLIIK